MFYKWQVLPYRNIPVKDPQNYIFSGDIVRLKHAETTGYLSHDEESRSLNGEAAYVRIFRG